MTGRGEKGLLITTGTFTREACLEASRDGARTHWNLSVAKKLVDLLRDHDLGVHTTKRIVEDISVDAKFFHQFEP